MLAGDPGLLAYNLLPVGVSGTCAKNGWPGRKANKSNEFFGVKAIFPVVKLPSQVLAAHIILVLR